MNNFDEVFSEFRKHRVKIKKPMTPYAEKLILDKLSRLFPNDEAGKIESLNQSIEAGYWGVFPLKIERKELLPVLMRSGTTKLYSQAEIDELVKVGKVRLDREKGAYYFTF